jgi:voltage-gated potassium channel
MPFLLQLSVAAALVTLTLSVQSIGMAGFIIWGQGFFARSTGRLGAARCAHLVVRVSGAMLILQLLEVVLWAGFYRWKCFPSWDPALYFSTTSYSTVGYGDLLLPSAWRLLGPIESITGVLMCGLSASVLFAIVTRLVRHEERFLPAVSEPASEEWRKSPVSTDFHQLPMSNKR